MAMVSRRTVLSRTGIDPGRIYNSERRGGEERGGPLAGFRKKGNDGKSLRAVAPGAG